MYSLVNAISLVFMHFNHLILQKSKILMVTTYYLSIYFKI